jgi:hypothetical protein
MTEHGVLERVKAIPVLLDLLPAHCSPGSQFGEDAKLTALDVYSTVRAKLLEGVMRTISASRILQDKAQIPFGTHLIILRPALVSAAKGWWMVDSTERTLRVWRTCSVVAADRVSGAKAMRNAQRFGGSEVFGQIADRFEEAREALHKSASTLRETAMRVPADTKLIIDLASAIDRYYGTTNAGSDALLLWNSASGLAHGEGWYGSLFGRSDKEGPRRGADILTDRSFDITCSGLHVLAMRMLELAATPAREAT